MKEVEQEHEKVIEKLREKDIEGAEHMMEEHIRITEKNVLERFKE